MMYRIRRPTLSSYYQIEASVDKGDFWFELSDRYYSTKFFARWAVRCLVRRYKRNRKQEAKRKARGPFLETYNKTGKIIES